ncbi:hypothetical protein TCAL_00541 [Tigriopus californicus]|uniref:Methionine aminopeptidase n=1 Tax=Tigriopus californicus TaxID=6832 RepID=A0A553PCT8_TIGCA|nr:methionine aminopeptidase 1D, mitochondrial-like [Tigriopus californicus]TRY75501.1 hypothetical protein TCAL_00541 [Tigriopus californicus]|eukprot:TCALIF_00541-PA protein Name:"Similar to metap1d Methionine aminopeptidase 1D, mitochondrial (Danio rerio)" AED:0.03 eAED:0.03 QI:0/-1/0/1/-1/1/1/0/320
MTLWRHALPGLRLGAGWKSSRARSDAGPSVAPTYVPEVVQPGRVTPMFDLSAWPAHIPIPDSVPSALPEFQFTFNTPEEVCGIRRSAQLARRMLGLAQDLAQPGITTEAIDTQVREAVIREGAYPSTLNFQGFPKSLSTSVNNVACHGVPDDRALRSGDLVTVDMVVYYRGFHGDVSRTFMVGRDEAWHDPTGRHLMTVARECLYAGISACGPGLPLRRIGQVIGQLAKRRGLGVIPTLCGHGIGRDFHCPPDIYHVPNNYPGLMKPGMVFTIEPCVSLGTPEFYLAADGWSLLTSDNTRTAQFEHTIAITEKGVDILSG